MLPGLEDYRHILLVDFEFASLVGGIQYPIVAVAFDWVTNEWSYHWEDELWSRGDPPYPTGPRDLFVAYYASAEVKCHLALGWEPPYNVLDLFTEFRVRTNGIQLFSGSGLLGALNFYGLDAMDASVKEANRELALSGGPGRIWTPKEPATLTNYCKQDVEALRRLLRCMLS